VWSVGILRLYSVRWWDDLQIKGLHTFFFTAMHTTYIGQFILLALIILMILHKEYK